QIAARTWPVFNNESLTEPLGEPLPHQARGDISPAARREANNDAHGPHRIGLRPRHARDRGKSGGASRKSKNSATWMLCHQPPLVATVDEQPTRRSNLVNRRFHRALPSMRSALTTARSTGPVSETLGLSRLRVRPGTSSRIA